jgi:hypothetical protein
MEGRREVTFSSRGRMRLRFGGPDDKVLDAAAGTRWTVRVTQGAPAVLSVRVQLGEFRTVDRDGLSAAQEEWRARGIAVRVHVLGAVYGIAGKVIDNRRNLLLVDEALSPEEASRRQAELLRQYGVRTTFFEEVRTPARAILELRDESGVVVGLAQDRLDAETPDGAGFDVRQVEYGVGYDFHGFEDRTFRGALQLVVDRAGTLAVVNVVPLEDLLKGLVPSEIFARAHPEALKAQAVTARGEVRIRTSCALSSTAPCTGAAPARWPAPRPPWRLPGAWGSSARTGGWWTRSTARCVVATPRTTTSSGAGRRTRHCADAPTCCPPRAAFRFQPTWKSGWPPRPCRPPAGCPASRSPASSGGRSASRPSRWTP